MALKKSELYSSLWSSCDELRGGMDASQYKDYVLVLLFVKYVSDKAQSQKNYLLDVPKGGSFTDLVALKGDKEIGDKMNTIVGKLVPGNDAVHKVSIIPRGAALGVTMFLPTEDRHLMTRQQMRARIAMALGGRVAEEIVFGA